MTAYIKLLYLILLFNKNDCAKILAMFPLSTYSHQMVFRSFINELAQNGHEVVLITPMPPPPEETADKVKVVDISEASKILWPIMEEKVDYFTHLRVALENMALVFNNQFNSKEVKEIVQGKTKFDILIVESTAASPSLKLAEYVDVPVIFISSIAPNYKSHCLGTMEHPHFYPVTNLNHVTNVTIWNAISEFYGDISYRYLMSRCEDDLNSLVGPSGAKGPPLGDLKKKVQIELFTVHSIWDNNRPMPINGLHLGTIHTTSPGFKSSFSDDLKGFLDLSQNGVIYVSFGTTLKTSHFPTELIQLLTNVFSNLTYDVLWKYDEDDLPEQTSKIKRMKWLPQPKLLRHPKIKLFITQGGLQSSDEAILAGVPLIGMPVFGDQFYNTQKYVEHKIGLRLNMDTLREEQLLKSIHEVIDNKSYRENVVRLRSVVVDTRVSPLQRAVHWTERTLMHHHALHLLHTPAAHISWTQYYELELIATVVMSFLIIILAILKMTPVFVRIIVKKIRYYLL